MPDTNDKKQNPIKVSDEFRTNPLSFSAGGVTVLVIYKDGLIKEYDKIKYPKKYIETALANPLVLNAMIK